MLRLPDRVCVGSDGRDGVHGVRERRRSPGERHDRLHDVRPWHVHVLQLSAVHGRMQSVHVRQVLNSGWGHGAVDVS